MLNVTPVKVAGDKLHLIKVDNLEPTLKANYEDKKNSDENWKRDLDLKHVGRIPFSIWFEWEKLGITKDPKALLAALEAHPELKCTTKIIKGGKSNGFGQSVIINR